MEGEARFLPVQRDKARIIDKDVNVVIFLFHLGGKCVNGRHVICQ